MIGAGLRFDCAATIEQLIAGSIMIGEFGNCQVVAVRAIAASWFVPNIADKGNQYPKISI